MFICVRIILLFLLFTNLIIAEIIPVGRPNTDITYKYARELYLRGFLKSADMLITPLDYSAIDSLWTPDRPIYLDRVLIPLQQMNINRTEIDRLNFKTALIPHGFYSDDTKHTYLAIIPELDYRISNSWAIQTAYRVDGALVDDSLYTGKKWDNFAGYAEMAVLSYRGQHLSLDLGRSRHAWGISGNGNNLLLSSTAFPLDGLSIKYHLADKISFYSIIAALAPVDVVSPFTPDTLTENRYFSAHALRISPCSWWDIVLMESVVYGGAGRQLEPAYAIPFIWFHAEQLNKNADDNTFLGIGSVIRLKNRYAGYMEILLDDYQIENKNASDNEPSEYGVIAGIDIFDFPLEMGTIEMEYTRIANYTYNQLKSRNVYINQGYPIGHPFGPDHESLKMMYAYHFKNCLTAEITAYIQNRGEGRLGDQWDALWLSPDYQENFPSGVVEKTRGISAGFFFHKNDFLKSKMLLDLADIQNDGNISGADKTAWSMRLEIIINLPKISWRLNDD